MALYDRIGIGYDGTRRADPYLLSRILHYLAPRRDARYLDVGSGTGNYTIAMRQAGVPICGVEVSATMLERASAKSREVKWFNGNILALPFRDRAFAGATMTFVHHHLGDNAIAGFREINRVLAPGARFVLLNATAEQLRHYWLHEYFPKTCEEANAPYENLDTVEALTAAGLKFVAEEKYDVAEDLQDWFMYCGKHHPERYLDPRVRSGISGFANASDPVEIERGVERLADDIRTGRIAEVMRKYAWDGGDYMFTIAAKP
jgi:ubiquinone/menaquinone biosynthesis C-methylase UbiE